MSPWNLVEDVGQLVPEEDRDDRGGRFVGPQAVIVGSGRHDRTQQRRVRVHRSDHGGAEDQELGVLVRRLAGIEEVALGRVAEREVDVLARAVHARERLLVEQAGHPVPLGHAPERHHEELLVVGREIGGLEHGGHLVLPGGDLVVPRLHRNAELVELALALEHEGQHALRDGAEVVILELLPLRRGGAEQGAARRHQVGSREVEGPVDEEVLLLRAGEREDGRGLGASPPSRSPSPSSPRRRCRRSRDRDRCLRRWYGPSTDRPASGEPLLHDGAAENVRSK